MPTPKTEAINITFSRCNDFTRETEWNEWYDNVHIPDGHSVGGFWTATRWEITSRPPGGYPALGFTHLNIKETAGPNAVERMRPKKPGIVDTWRAQGRLHPTQGVIATMPFRVIGRWQDKPAPSPRTTGLFLVFTTCTDPRVEDEWNEWYDNVHVPDVMQCGFAYAVTRWVRVDYHPFQTNYLGIYEIEDPDPDAAVRRMAQHSPTLRPKGRVHPNHCGGMNFTVRPVGKYAGIGSHALVPAAQLAP